MQYEETGIPNIRYLSILTTETNDSQLGLEHPSAVAPST